ncbi:hypothetical protein [Pseudoscardovia suis]|uniref:Uncharacterized protein n=1 Tax=Pseudoscardovia suis TaxID=987063 RepID=A0A261EYK2_9BIFI|nr:hypothetical protein [Pseudoscardovia suis]OZG51931.1 hypothetical protein PSSU_0714 [Pseudoscardovia suis]PJJ69471.1 hypothetical protein CLV65_0174 [Pseudoscardovia suis]
MNDGQYKALLIIAIIGIIVSVLGFIAVAVRGNFGDFMAGATPGVLLGLSLLVIIVINGKDSR